MLNNWTAMTFVATRDAARAKKFYGGILQMPFIEEDGYAMVFDNRGIRLRIAIAAEFTPAGYTVLGWAVADIEQAVTELELAGVQMTRYGFLTQGPRGIWDAPGGARVAWFTDPDGNVLSVSQH